MKAGAKFKNSLADIAFGYELKCEGATWHYAAKMVGMTRQSLRAAVNRIMKDGIKKPR